jgi:hypothetical protein
MVRSSKRWVVRPWPPANWLTVEWLSKYAPELNEIEPV